MDCFVELNTNELESTNGGGSWIIVLAVAAVSYVIGYKQGADQANIEIKAGQWTPCPAPTPPPGWR